jgi:phosphomannomutase/phosphoglucomutase
MLSTALTPPEMKPSTPSTDFFCTYDLRAIVTPGVFDETTYGLLGKAFAYWLQTHKGWDINRMPTISVGYDARIHSKALTNAFIESLTEMGIHVIKLGMVPSPLVYFSEYYCLDNLGLPKPEACVVVTASHNPAPYNGMKLCVNGISMTKDELIAFKACFVKIALGEVVATPFGNDKIGHITYWSPLEAYTNWTKDHFGRFPTRPKVVVDCGNATAGVIAPQVMEALGCEVISLFAEPDGNFPNHHPDPCVHANLRFLQEAVLANQADMGVAFDGDSDRVGVVDAQGRIISGDMLLIFLTQDMLAHGTFETPPTVVSEVKCSQHLFDTVATLGAMPVLSPTGHAYIKQKMRDIDAKLGGELSGHFFFRDTHWGFDDGIYAALRLVRFLADARRVNPNATMATLYETLPTSFLSEELRLPVPVADRPAVMTALHNAVMNLPHFAELPVVSIETIDGIRFNVQGGFWLCRISNTEPVLTLRWEAPSAEHLMAIETALKNLLQTVISSVIDQWDLKTAISSAAHH